MDYLDFYGLEREPFSMAPVSKFYFNSAQHSRAIVRLMYAVDTMKGLAVLIGDIGTGKTTLARRMLDALPDEEYESALLVIVHSGITANWMLERIAMQLGVENPATDKLALLSQLFKRLIYLYEHGKKAVVLIDEAQMLQTREIMEEFRGLLNLEMPERKLITFVFFGLPEIENNLKLDMPLEQRVALKYRLEPFNEESTHGYIHHRLRLSGSHEKIFSDAAAKVIHRYSRGIPRLINTICDNALFEGYLLRRKEVGPDLIASVVHDLGLGDGEVISDEIMASRENFDTAESRPQSPAAPPPPPKAAPPKTAAAPPKPAAKPAPAPAPQPGKSAAEKTEEKDIDSMLDGLEEG